MKLVSVLCCVVKVSASPSFTQSIEGIPPLVAAQRSDPPEVEASGPACRNCGTAAVSQAMAFVPSVQRASAARWSGLLWVR
ncbi:MAG: hypothetical protein IPO05_18620 [Flavobacteriales bacterium]|nr:hypothetical protein [Flavobacteriales bacterium]